MLTVDGPRVVETEQVLRKAAHEEIRSPPGPSVTTADGSGPHPDSRRAGGESARAPAEQRTRPAEHFAFHEPQVRTAQEEHNIARILPASVPRLLQPRENAGARGRNPLKLVERNDELGSGAGSRPLRNHGDQRLAPVGGSKLGQQRHAERTGGFLQELTHLQCGRGLLPQIVDTGVAGHEFQDKLALADPASAVDRNELRAGRSERPLQYAQFRRAPDESRHGGSMPKLRNFVKSCFDKSYFDKLCFDKS